MFFFRSSYFVFLMSYLKPSCLSSTDFCSCSSFHSLYDFSLLNREKFFACLRRYFISPSIQHDNLAGQSILGCMFFPLITSKIPCHTTSGLQIVCRKISIPLYMTFSFSYCLQNSFSPLIYHFNYSMSWHRSF